MNKWKEALEASGEGIFDWDILTGDLSISNFPKIAKFSDIEKLVHPDDNPSFKQTVAAFLRSNNEKIYSGEYQFKRDDGRYSWVLILGKIVKRDKSKRPIKFIGTILDISQRKKVEEKLLYESEHDTLTGVYRREYFQKVIDKINDEKKLGPRPPFSILLIDINGLKEANDKYGHLAGDTLIADTASLLQNFVRTQSWKRKEDFVVRWGGDEFLVVLDDCSNEYARVVLARLMQHVEKYNNLKPELKKIRFSIGVGSSDILDKNSSVEDVIGIADEEMYLGKLDRIEHNRSGIIKYLLNRLEEKDYIVAGELHSLRVMARVMAKTLVGQRKMTLGQGILLDLLCLLHDIGKIEMANVDIKNRRKLGDSEKSYFREHALAGSEMAPMILNILQLKIIDASKFPKLILHHHEHWDGKGYPGGLKGEHIPIEDRVFSIIDAYEAMTNERPFRSKLSPLKALERLKTEAGKQFDPELVDLFISEKVYNI